MGILILRGSSASGGAIADGAAYTITGSGFGTRSTSQEWLGGLNGVIDSMANGDRFDQLGRAGWSLLTPSTSRYPTCSTERAWSRGKSLVHDTRGGAEYKQSLFFDATSYSSMYTSNKCYLAHDTLTTGYLQHKMIRWLRTETVVDGDGSYMANRLGATRDSFLNTFNSAGTSTYWMDGTAGTTPLPTAGSWYHLETWLKMNSTPGTADGYFRVRVTDPSAGTVLMDNVSTNRVYNGSSDSGTYRYICFQNYFGNADVGEPSGAGNGNAHGVMWWDDHLIQYGTSDDALKICYLTDASTWAASTVKEVQPVSSWADTSISLTINQGAHANLTGKYFHLFAGIPSAQVGSGILLA